VRARERSAPEVRRGAPAQDGRSGTMPAVLDRPPILVSPRAPCAGAFQFYRAAALASRTPHRAVTTRTRGGHMANAEKISAVAEITEHFSTSNAAVITEYRGLTVKQITDLRTALGRDTTYAVVKNTLTKRAATAAGVSIDDALLAGPTAIAFVKGDPVDAAKGLRDFARTNPLLVIKGGVLDGKSITAAEVAKIADLESREVLLAKLAGALKALPTRAAALFQAPLSQMARLAKALEEKKEADAPAPAAASAETASADTALVDDDAPVAETVIEDASNEAGALGATDAPITESHPAEDSESAEA
jgi:large subunit ribosomal protein L10